MSDPARPTVWITRPQPGADRTAAAVEAMGFTPVLVPLTEVVAIDPVIGADDLARANAVAVTSANAIRLAPDPLIAALRGKPVYTVGDATADMAKSRGLGPVRSGDGAVDDLVALISGHETPGNRLLYLCGRTRTGDLEGKLGQEGFPCQAAEVYATNKVSRSTYIDAAFSMRAGLSAVLFHSALSAETFASLEPVASGHVAESARLFCLSERVCAALPPQFGSRVTVAASPNDASLLAALADSLRPRGN